MLPKILVVDDEPSHCKMLEAVLSAEGYEVVHASNGAEAIAEVGKRFFDLILMDIRMQKTGGIEALKAIKEISPGIPIIMMTAYASVETAVAALKSGAYDYLTKPLDIDELKIMLAHALRHHRLEQENLQLKEQLDDRFDFSSIIGSSTSMKKVFETVALVAPTEVTVLICGESGTGKELVANAIHHNSPRGKRPFVKVNCAALPETLLESELFGHEKGAFTGAVNRRKGRFQLAHGSSIFLDEIAEMAPMTQAKILRVLQERSFEVVGGSETLQVDTRVIAATNRNLEEEIRAGRFREDLFYRLNVVKIEVPPLRDRCEDIPLLANFFINQYAEKNRRHIKGLTPRALDLFMRYEWPGNVRELENAIERAVIMARGDMVAPDALPEAIQALGASSGAALVDLPAGRSLKEVEKEMILRTLAESGGNRTQASKILGISRRTLQLKLKDYGIHPT
ncbi:MAG: sigma-54-dependent Fis family transcriptional regulator [Deltaproteobacteria bacterium]|nr:sigma-54-dependent Fis family transcriptional regulator [Deltaproteobacteria bacterium]